MRDFSDYLDRFLGTGKTIRVLTAVLLIGAAFLFSGVNGEKGDADIERTEGANNEIVSQKENDTGNGAVIYVDVGGEVRAPGVYELEQGSRVFQVIDMAGGLTEEADTSSINQAETLEDGGKIFIPSKKAHNGSEQRSGIEEKDSNKININDADATELQNIPGVGPVTADKIIDYRDSNGPFKSIEDLKQISGIGDKTFEKMRDLVCI